MQLPEFYRSVVFRMSVPYVAGEIIRTESGFDLVVDDTNNAFISVFDASSFSGLHLSSLFCTPKSAGLFSRAIEIFSGGDSSAFEINDPDKGRWFEVSGFLSEPGHAVFLFVDITKQRKASNHMVENLSNITSVINTIPNPVFYKDDCFRYIFFNQAFEDFVGYDRAALLGKTAGDIAAPDLVPDYLASDRVVSETKKFHSYEGKVLHSDGTMHNVLFYKSPILTGSGDLRGIVGIILDITERKTMEEELRKFKHAVEQSPSSIIMTDPAGTIEYVNPRFTVLTGYTLEESKGKNPNMLNSGLMPHAHYERLWATISSGGVWHGEFYNRKKDGTLYWESASISPIKDQNGTINSYIAIKEDITDRKRMEASLRESEAIMKALLDAVQDPVILIGRDTAVLALNDFGAERLGRTSEECIGQPLSALVDETIMEKRVGLIDDVIESGVPYRWEDSQDGKYYDLMAYPVLDAAGKVYRVAVYARDITEHKKNEVLLRDLVGKAEHARLEAERANREKSNFLAAMSHEIRTPLNAIIGMTDLALMTDSDIEKLDYLHTVKDSSLHLLSVINDVLDFSKLEAGKFVLKKEPFNPKKIIDSSISILASQAQLKNLSLEFFASENIAPSVTGDGSSFKQIVINLLGNAIKFTEKGSVRVELSSSPCSDGTVVLTLKISDTGIGIPRERMDIIFESFTRANAYTGSKYGGSGLGLSICRNLTRLMGGTISVESTVGDGSCFTVAIPFPTEAPPVITSRDSSRSSGSEKFTVLVAEDNAVNVKFLSIVLSKLGHTFDIAGNGREAIELCRGKDYDIILMDIEMPEVDGFEASRRIRSGDAGRNADVPILALTGYGIAEIQDRCNAAGMDGCVTKPLRIEEVERKILEAISRRKGVG